MMRILPHMVSVLVLASTASARQLLQGAPLRNAVATAADTLNITRPATSPLAAAAGQNATTQSYPSIKAGLRAATSTPSANLSVLSEALNASGLTLSNLTNVTILAPTDEAFKKRLPELGLTQQQLLDPQNNSTLIKILSYHVIEGVYNSTNSTDGANVTTLGGGNVSVTVDTRSSPYDVSFRNPNATYNASVLYRDIETNDSIVHVVDDVLVPSSVAAGAADMTVTATQGAAGNATNSTEPTAGGTNSTA